ncbi:hypothetical protein ABBQ38_013220 [Trebouxia sp. C0009 RCD-2024]
MCLRVLTGTHRCCTIRAGTHRYSTEHQSPEFAAKLSADGSKYTSVGTSGRAAATTWATVMTKCSTPASSGRRSLVFRCQSCTNCLQGRTNLIPVVLQRVRSPLLEQTLRFPAVVDRAIPLPLDQVNALVISIALLTLLGSLQTEPSSGESFLNVANEVIGSRVFLGLEI